jgi:hypothetical protein
VEPLIAKKILPLFGGSAAVWSVCLVFFQTALLLGYLYTRVLSRYLRPQIQTVVHIGLLLVSLTALPLGPGDHLKSGPTEDPVWPLLELLTVALGLPFLVLSATSPLLQDWLARGGHKTPYRLFALSNLASLLALLSYPLLVEPSLNLRVQSIIWSTGYAVFVALCALCAWKSRTSSKSAENAAADHSEKTISLGRKLTWLALAACGSMLLLSITNHISENVAAVPFLWVLPLAIYLLTFILCFNFSGIYKRALALRILAMALGILGYAIYDIQATEIVQVTLPIFLLGLFAGCLFCHGELNRLRPEPRQLTSFYWMLSLGGAAGAIFVGLVAPRLFAGIYELPLSLALTAALALALTWQGGWAVRLLWTGVTTCMLIVFGANVQAYEQNSLSLRRSFYGSLRVVQSPHGGETQKRTLFHGTITHGAQFLLPPRRLRPTTYYGPDSGIGIVLRECFPSPKRVGIIGLGVGTIAAYGQSGDTFRFYEINQQVVDMAQSLFTYLRETPAHVEIANGDARLSIEQDSSPPFDVLAVDAFSGDAIPVHLLTIEAARLYEKHLKSDGVLAFHISNQYLDLAPIVQKLSENMGRHAVLVKNHQDAEDLIEAADWVLVTSNPRVLQNTAIKLHSAPLLALSGLHLWTDDFNNLFQIFKAPHLALRTR